MYMCLASFLLLYSQCTGSTYSKQCIAALLYSQYIARWGIVQLVYSQCIEQLLQCIVGKQLVYSQCIASSQLFYVDCSVYFLNTVFACTEYNYLKDILQYQTMSLSSKKDVNFSTMAQRQICRKNFQENKICVSFLAIFML